MILKSWSDAISGSSGDNHGHAVGTFTIEISSLQSVSKCWHVVCWIIFSMDQLSASSYECKDDNLLSLFFNPRNCSFPLHLSIPNHIRCTVNLQSKILRSNKYFASIRHVYFVFDVIVVHHRWTLSLHQTKRYIYFGHATCPYFYGKLERITMKKP